MTHNQEALSFWGAVVFASIFAGSLTRCGDEPVPTTPAPSPAPVPMVATTTQQPATSTPAPAPATAATLPAANASSLCDPTNLQPCRDWANDPNRSQLKMSDYAALHKTYVRWREAKHDEMVMHILAVNTKDYSNFYSTNFTRFRVLMDECHDIVAAKGRDPFQYCENDLAMYKMTPAQMREYVE